MLAGMLAAASSAVVEKQCRLSGWLRWWQRVDKQLAAGLM